VNVLVLHSQVPFVRGGAELLVEGLARALDERGHVAEVVALPLAWNPVEGLLSTALAWRMLDLSRFNDKLVDRVICTKYPTWAVRHPRKSLWLVHQHRQAYDLHATPLSEFRPDADSQDVRRRVVEIDRRGISECRPRYAISRNVAGRLRRYNDIVAEPLYPPVPHHGLAPKAFEPFVLSVARLDAAKRVDRAIDAWTHVDSGLRLVVVGDGPDRDRLSALIRRRGLAARVSLLGRVDDATLVDLYNRCRAVYYAPIDEDYGLTAVEALSAGKPVVTAPDSGGVLEFVTDGSTGLVVPLEGRELAEAFNRLVDEGCARRLGATGPALTADIGWDTVVERLLDD
jgi:glycosyltransferase involved in cell wall biosynthesis